MPRAGQAAIERLVTELHATPPDPEGPWSGTSVVAIARRKNRFVEIALTGGGFQLAFSRLPRGKEFLRGEGVRGYPSSEAPEALRDARKYLGY